MATSRHVMLMVVATLVVLFVGSADAWDRCPSGYKNCNHKKGCDTYILNDVKNCGDCGKECKVEWKDGAVTCKHGECKQYCKDGYEYDWKKKCCVPKCKADTENDVNNCGKCGNKCKLEWKDGEVTCKHGECEQYCKEGYEYDWQKKCCVPKCKADTENDVNNCGKCGNKCKVEWKDGEVTCKHGECEQYCKDGYEYDWKKKCCVPKCKADTENDVNNCGKCGNKCKVEWKDGEVTCTQGECEQYCKEGYEYDLQKKCCVPKCKADTENDVNNCGKCGNKCNVEWKDGEVTCKHGECKQHCKDGYEYDWKKKCCVPKKHY